MLTAANDRLPRETDNLAHNQAPLILTLPMADPIVLDYITQFDEDQHVEKAVEALKVGVIALKSASPTLDMRVVHDKGRGFNNFPRTPASHRIQYGGGNGDGECS